MISQFLYLVAICFGLGILHGVIPDEHTWPITFNYSVGAATGKGGRRAGMWFSLAFLTQRAIMSELIFFAFALFLIFDPNVNGPVYIAVGLAMALAGWLILRGKIWESRFLPHMRLAKKGFDEIDKKATAEGKLTSGQDMPVHWCLIHGFISGFGQDSGIFTGAVLLGASIAPSFTVGWLPGAAFGLGTFFVLMMIGFLFGGALNVSNRWGKKRMARFGKLVGARSLVSGGITFVFFGILYILGIGNSIQPIIDYGTLIVIVCMVILTAPIIFLTWREVKHDHSLDDPEALAFAKAKIEEEN